MSMTGGVVTQMDYITTKEASQKWGYKEVTIRKWCKDGLIFVLAKPIKKEWTMANSCGCRMSKTHKNKNVMIGEYVIHSLLAEDQIIGE